MSELMNWVAAVPTLAGLALALGLSPTLYGVTAEILARNQNVRARLAWLLGGLGTGATVLVLLLHSANPANFVSEVHHRGEAVAVDRLVDLVVGVVLLLAAATMALWRWIAPDTHRRQTRDPDRNAPPARLFVLGFGSSVVGFTTLPIAYLTGRLIEGLSTDPLVRLVAYSVFLSVLFAPFVLLAWIWSRFPVAARKVTAMYGRVLTWDFRWPAIVVLGVGGLSLLGFTLLAPR